MASGPTSLPWSLLPGPFERRGGGTPVSDPRSFHGEGRGYPSQVLGWGTPLSHSPSPQTVQGTDRVCRRSYASCCHTGGLSCFKIIFGLHNSDDCHSSRSFVNISNFGTL